jgi:LysR family hydrogen peroxide-inducible transcriptional activator
MNLRDIKYLVAVADLRHFGRAAALCHVSQPTLSMQLKKLEETLDVKLFERSNRKVLLTSAGEAVVARARLVLDASEQMVQAAKAAHDPLAGEITLGVFPTLAPYLLPLVMPVITKYLPKLSVNLLEEKTDTLITQLESGQIDCALLAQPVRSTLLLSEPLFEEPFTLAVSAGHALAARKKIQTDDLDGHTLLLLDEGHCLREQALSVCQRIGAQESQHFRATSLETLRQMVASGSAMTLIPKLAVRADRNITYIPFVKPPSRDIALYYRKTSAQVPLMHKLAATIAATAQKHLN